MHILSSRPRNWSSKDFVLAVMLIKSSWYSYDIDITWFYVCKCPRICCFFKCRGVLFVMLKAGRMDGRHRKVRGGADTTDVTTWVRNSEPLGYFASIQPTHLGSNIGALLLQLNTELRLWNWNLSAFGCICDLWLAVWRCKRGIHFLEFSLRFAFPVKVLILVGERTNVGLMMMSWF